MGYNIGPTIAIKGEQEYQRAMNAVRQNMKYIKAEAATLTSEYNKNDKSVESLTAANKGLRMAQEQQQKAVKDTQAALERMKEEGVDESSEAYKAMKANLDNATAALNTTKREIEDNEKAIKELNSEAERRPLEQYAKSVRSAGEAMQKVGKTLSMAVTAPLVAAGAAAIKMSADYENAMAKVATLTGKSALPELAEGILELSNATGIAANELAEAQYQAISAGVDAAESVDFLEITTKMTKGGFTEAATAVDGLTTVLNSYGIALDEAGRIANYFLITQNKGKTTVDELASGIGQVASTANAAGVSVEDLFAALASLTAGGVQTSQAISSLKAAVSNIIKPSGEAKEAAISLGIDFSVTALKAQGLGGFLSTLGEATEGNVATMGRLFGSTEALNAVLRLTSTEGAKLLNDTLSEMKTNTGALDDAFNTVTGTKGAAVEIALNKIKNAAIKLGDALSPTLTLLADIITAVADTLGSMSAEQQKVLVVTLMLTAAIGPLVRVIGKATTGVAGLIDKVAKAGSLAGLITGPTGWIALAVGAVAGLVGAISSVVAKHKELTSAANDLREATKAAKEKAEEANATYVKTANETMSTATLAERYVERLKELRFEIRDNKEAQEEYAAIVRILNNLIPDLNLALDEQTGHIKGGTDALQDQIEAWKANAMAQAMEEQVAKATEAYTSALIAQEKSRLELEQYKATLQNVNDEMDNLEYNILPDLDRGTEEFAAANERYADLIHQSNDLKTSIESVVQAIKENDAEVATLAKDMQIEVETAQALIDRVAEGTASDEDVAALSDAISTLGTELEEADEAAKKFTETVDNMYQQFSGAAQSMLERIEENTDVTLEKMIENLKHNQKAIAGWAANLKTLAEKGVDRGFLEVVRQMGPQYAGLVQQMVDATPEQLAELIAAWRGGGEMAYEAAYELATEYARGMGRGLKDIALEVAKEGGADMARALINSTRQTLEIASPSKVAIRMAHDYGDGISVGLYGKLQQIRAASSALAKAMISTPEYRGMPRLTLPDNYNSTKTSIQNHMPITIRLYSQNVDAATAKRLAAAVNRELGRMIKAS